MIQVKKDLLAALEAAIQALAHSAPSDLKFETPKHASQGDLSITAAMALAKELKTPPRDVAAKIVAALQAHSAIQQWVSSIEIAGPGFINLHLSPAAKQSVISEILRTDDQFGHQPSNGHRVMVEFVSANPTGPLHVGHGRQGVLGDALCRLLASQGHAVTREFYYNDAGVQIATLAHSVQARARGLQPGDSAWPENAYNGEYISDIAAAYVHQQTVYADDRSFTGTGDLEDLDAIRQFAVAFLRHEQDLDLQAFGVQFDHYYLESSLYSSGRVTQIVEKLQSTGVTYEQDGALWLRTTDYGDDKDRVMQKSDGTYTYFVPDVAYHLHKWQRGFHQAINIQGTDHHGTIARVRAGLRAADAAIPPQWPAYVLHKMVTVMKNGEEVKISKRAGSYVTLRDLIDWTGKDAVRFFLISRKADTEFVFDVDLALKQNDENPVFYVQYAHARIYSVIQQWIQSGGQREQLAKANFSLLMAPTELALMMKLATFPEMLSQAAAGLTPHDIAFYVRDLAANFHSYYAAERFLVDDAALTCARLSLLAATQQVLSNALGLLGVSAPSRMERENPTS
jgi:arginyl-tRNA synthetase